MKMIIQTIEDWDRVAEQVAPLLAPGTILALSGPLGAGKTTFVQALARVLGAKVSPRSPSFSLVRSYALHPTSYNLSLSRLVHVDAYRLEHAHDVLPLGLDDELAEPGTVIAIEWPERVSDWMRGIGNRVIELTIHIDPSGVRRVEVRP